MSSLYDPTRSCVLKVTITHLIYPVTEKVLCQLFDVYGVNEVCMLQQSTHLEAYVEFQSWHEAGEARSALHGRCIYDGCCLLDIQHAPLSISVIRLPNSEPVVVDWDRVELEPLSSSSTPLASTLPTPSATITSTVKISSEVHNAAGSVAGKALDSEEVVAIPAAPHETSSWVTVDVEEAREEIFPASAGGVTMAPTTSLTKCVNQAFLQKNNEAFTHFAVCSSPHPPWEPGWVIFISKGVQLKIVQWDPGIVQRYFLNNLNLDEPHEQQGHVLQSMSWPRFKFYSEEAPHFGSKAPGLATLGIFARLSTGQPHADPNCYAVNYILHWTGLFDGPDLQDQEEKLKYVSAKREQAMRLGYIELTPWAYFVSYFSGQLDCDTRIDYRGHMTVMLPFSLFWFASWHNYEVQPACNYMKLPPDSIARALLELYSSPLGQPDYEINVASASAMVAMRSKYSSETNPKMHVLVKSKVQHVARQLSKPWDPGVLIFSCWVVKSKLCANTSLYSLKNLLTERGKYHLHDAPWHFLKDGVAPCQSGRYALTSVRTRMITGSDSKNDRVSPACNLTIITIHAKAVFYTISSPFLQVKWVIQDRKEGKLALGLLHKGDNSVVSTMCSCLSLTKVMAAVNEIVMMILFLGPATSVLSSSESAHLRYRKSWPAILRPVTSETPLSNGDIVKSMLSRIHEIADLSVDTKFSTWFDFSADATFHKVFNTFSKLLKNKHPVFSWDPGDLVARLFAHSCDTDTWDPGGVCRRGLRASRNLRGRECHAPLLTSWASSPWALGSICWAWWMKEVARIRREEEHT